MTIVDIISTEREKTIVGKAMALLRLRFGDRANIENIHKYLLEHPNPLIRLITNTTNRAANNIKNEMKQGGTQWQSDNIIRMTEFALWCLVNHEKYYKIFEKFAPLVFEEYKTTENPSKKAFNALDKQLMKLMLIYTHKRLHEQWTYQLLLDEMEKGSNTSVRLVLNKIATAIEDIESKTERIILYDLASVGLWWAQHDTAYRDIFFWILHEIGNDEIRKAVEPFYLPPEKWYINIWHDHKIISEEKRAKGEINVFGHDMVEEMSVPAMRNAQLDKIVKKGSGKNSSS